MRSEVKQLTAPTSLLLPPHKLALGMLQGSGSRLGEALGPAPPAKGGQKR